MPPSDIQFMRLALRLAARGYGTASPNPMVGAVLVKSGKIIGRGWHHRPGLPHGEIEALLDAQRKKHDPRGATLYVTLEPCCTHGRTPPCTDAIRAAGIKRVVIGATDSNPNHAGRAFNILRRAGIEVSHGLLVEDCTRLNTAFNHWIIHRTPLVTVKAAMTLDGKIATVSGESKWITGEKARAYGMKLRQGHDAILVGINTILADDPSLTFRSSKNNSHKLRRIVLDSDARTPLTSKVVTDAYATLTTIVVNQSASKKKISALARHVNVLVAPGCSQINLGWLLDRLGKEEVASLLVEGGGEVNASFLMGGFAHRIALFYAPKIFGGRNVRKAVAGDGILKLADAVTLKNTAWRKLGNDLLLTADVVRK